MKWLSRHWVLSHKSQLAPCQTGLARREPGGESAWQQQELGGGVLQELCEEGQIDSCQSHPRASLRFGLRLVPGIW